MMLCRSCETAAHCSEYGCIPISDEPMPRADEAMGWVGWFYFAVSIVLCCLVVVLPLYFGSQP